jgi:hypothetical protein
MAEASADCGEEVFGCVVAVKFALFEAGWMVKDSG